MAPLHPVPTFRLSAFYFVYLAGLGAFAPYFALYLDARGISAVGISLAMSLWYGTRIFAPSAWSHLTLASQRPIAWLRIGTIATFVSLCGFVLELPYAGVLVVMAAYSFFYNATMPQFEAITLSHLGNEPARYGRIRVWGSVGFILVVTALGVVFDHVSVRHLPLFMLPIFVVLVATAFVNDYGPGHAAQGARESLVASVRRPGVAPFLALAFLMQVAHGPYYVFFSLFLDESGYRSSALGAFWALGVLAEIVMFWFSAAILKRHGSMAALRVCLLATAMRFFATALWPQLLPVMLVAQLSHALSFGLFHAASMQRVATLFPGRLLGQGQGLLYGLSSGVGGVVGSLLAGLAWEIGGGRAAFLLAAAVAAVGALLAWRTRDQGPPDTRAASAVTAVDEAA